MDRSTDNLTNRWQILLALCGVAAAVGFWVVVAFLGALRPGYSHLAQTVSELGASGAPNAAFQNANFLLTGLLMVGFAAGLHGAVGGGNGSWWGPGLVAVFGGFGLAGSGLLPCDPGCTGDTLADQLHFMAPTIGFPSVLAALFILPRRFRQDSAWKGHAVYTLATAWWGLLALILFYVGIGGAVAALEPFAGLLQRLFAWGVFLWVFVTSLRLYRQGVRPAQPSTFANGL